MSSQSGGHYSGESVKETIEMSRQRKKPGRKPDPSKPYSKYRPPKPRVYVPKTHCPQGHPYDAQNTYINPSGYKTCRTCVRERMRDRRLRGLEIVRRKSGGRRYRPQRVGQGGHNAAKTHCPRDHPYNEENIIYSKDGRRWCRTCARANSAVQVIKKYGITLDEYERLMEEQDRSCAICRQPFGDNKPHIDHDHSCCPGGKACGKCVRGLLCSDCNKGIGFFRDASQHLRQAANYLDRYRAA